MLDIIVVLGIILLVVNAVTKGKNVNKNRPGANPGQGAAGVPYRPPLEKGTARKIEIPYAPDESVQPTPSVAGAPVQQSFWDQLSNMLDATDEVPEEKSLNQGQSRECAHGSVGGSMPITTHEGEKKNLFPRPSEQLTEYTPKPSVNFAPADPETASGMRPAVSVAMIRSEDMRRAVIMSEVLKRPCERGRGWRYR